MEWEIQLESPWDDISGVPFYSVANSTVIPYVSVSLEDLLSAPTPLWITDIHPESPIGNIVENHEGTYWIELLNGFEDYLLSLEPKHQKKFRKNLNLNSDLSVTFDTPGVIDFIWPYYVDRLNTLAARNGAGNYTQAELEFRYNFYRSPGIRTIAIYKAQSLLAVNVSLWDNTTVYDLACMINPSVESLPRSLGTFAILKNINLAIDAGMKKYDLLANNYGYEKSYGAIEHKQKAIVIANEDFFNFYKIPQTLKYSL